MKRLILISIFIALCATCFSHSGKAKYHTIVDTDCSDDDLRCLCMLLASPEFEVLAITVSEGTLQPIEGYLKVRALLNDFGHQGIPVAYGKGNASNNGKNTIETWGNIENLIIPKEAEAGNLIRNSITNEDEKVLIICLGTLKNFVEIIQDNELASQIEQIVWFRDNSQSTNKQNFGIIQNTDIRKTIVDCNAKYFFPHNEFMALLSSHSNKYSDKIQSTHQLENNILAFRSDLIASYLLYPQYFEVTEYDKYSNLASPLPKNADKILESFIEILQSKTSKECKVFNVFPTDESLFAEDISVNISEIITKYGNSEWRAGVLTNELHGHLGIYAIVGVKMGIRVREYFNIGVDDILITSFAGSSPPTSCLNDGLQVSVGATIGHGLFTISEEEYKRPEAIFQFKNIKIKLKLKDRYWTQIKNDVKTSIDKYGKLTPKYWESIRMLAINYWLEFDRMELFEIEEIE